MDLEKIGKFIAWERKNKKYTQKQLADILNVSDRTISKWECGKGFPEVALLLPLCNKLEITVNELLTGERLVEENYMEKAEQNMVSFLKEKKENTIKMQLIVLMGIMSTISFITLLVVVCIYTEVISVPVKGILILIACTILLYKDEKTIWFFYRCNCRFIDSVWIVSFPRWKYSADSINRYHRSYFLCMQS